MWGGRGGALCFNFFAVERAEEAGLGRPPSASSPQERDFDIFLSSSCGTVVSFLLVNLSFPLFFLSLRLKQRLFSGAASPSVTVLQP